MKTMSTLLLIIVYIYHCTSQSTTTTTITSQKVQQDFNNNVIKRDQARFLENLTDDQFYAAIKKHRLSLVMFYAPWCDHCVHTIEEMRKAARLLGTFPRVTLMTVNAIEYDRVADYERVHAYPTLKMYSKGEFVDTYSGSYDAVGMAKFMQWYNQFFMNSVKLFSSKKAVERFLSEARDTVILGAFTQEFDSRLTELAKDLAMDYKFAYCMVEDLPLEILNLESIPGDDIVYVVKSKRYENQEERPRVMSTFNLDKKKFKNFLHETNLPLVGEINSMSRERYYDHTQDSILIVVYVQDLNNNNNLDSKRFQDITERIRLDVVPSFPDHIFAVADSSELSSDYSSIDVDDSYFVVTAERGRGEYIITHVLKKLDDTSFNSEGLNQFLQTLSLPNPIRGTRAETIQDELNTTKVVQFENTTELMRLFRDPLIVVFVALLEPSCSFCDQEFHKLLDGVATLFESEEDVLIGKMDVSITSHIPMLLRTNEFPAMFYNKFDKNGVPSRYYGYRDAYDIYQELKTLRDEKVRSWDRKHNKNSKDKKKRK